jgi:hypothetical protein
MPLALGGAEFIELFGHLAFARHDGTNTYASHETRAIIRGCSESACQRATTKLERDGWLVDTKRRKKDSAIRSVKIPQVILDAFPLEAQEPAKTPVLTDRSNFLNQRFCIQEQAKTLA